VINTATLIPQRRGFTTYQIILTTLKGDNELEISLFFRVK
jgi:hypothetical protein